jgi:hypothetical protein
VDFFGANIYDLDRDLIVDDYGLILFSRNNQHRFPPEKSASAMKMLHGDRGGA